MKKPGEIVDLHMDEPNGWRQRTWRQNVPDVPADS
jgi:hypothetical protein